MKPPVTNQLLTAYFAGQATVLQKQLIDDWLRDPANERAFYACLHEREQAHVQYEPDLETAIGHYRTYLHQPQPTEATHTDVDVPDAPPSRVGWRIWPRTWLIAATVLLCVGLVGWLFRNSLRYQTYRTAYGQTQQVQLADGSRVTLNANTRLLVPRFGFGSGTRTVQVIGEARFSVEHTAANQPFVVKTTANLDVTVQGTEFAVFARPRGTRVVLMRGKVTVDYQPDLRSPTHLTLNPGDMVTLDRRGQLHRQVLPKPDQQTAWTDHRFVFDNTSLREVGAMLYETFGLIPDIKDDRLASQTLSGSFDAHTADEFLAAVAEVLDIRYARRSNRVIFRRKPNN